MELKDAVWCAMEDCIENGVLADFLKDRRDDVVNALLTEYDEERVLRDLKEESFEDGVAEGETLKVIDLVIRKVKKGLAPEAIAELLEEDTDFIEEVCKIIHSKPEDCSAQEIYRKLKPEAAKD